MNSLHNDYSGGFFATEHSVGTNEQISLWNGLSFDPHSIGLESNATLPSFAMDSDPSAFPSSPNITLGLSPFDPHSMLPESLSNATLPLFAMDNDPFAFDLSSFSTLSAYSSPFIAVPAFPPLATSPSQPYNTGITPPSPPVLNVPPFATTYEESLSRPITYPSLRSPTNASRRNPSHVPRPRNSFIIYRTLFNAFAQQDQKNKKRDRRNQGETVKGRTLDARVISKEAAACWRALSQAEREIYQGLAKTEKELHMIKYPDYDYNYNAFNLAQKVTKSKSVKALSQSKSVPVAGFLPPVQLIPPSNLDDSLPSIFDMPNSSDYPGELYSTKDGALLSLANDSNKFDLDRNFLQTFINDAF